MSTKFVERAATEILKFEKVGDQVTGYLMEIIPVDGDKPGVKYIVHEPVENRFYEFFGSYDLNRKIRKTDIGKLLQIRFEKTEKVDANRSIKRFWVGVDTSVPKTGS